MSDQPALFPDFSAPQIEPKKLKLESGKLQPPESPASGVIVAGIPPLVLPTRWESLKNRLGDNGVSLRTIVQPIPQAMIVVKNIVEYLKTTDGCQVLVIRADTGSGKTTFLNTLPHYMPDVRFHTQTIDLQPIEEAEFSKELWQTQTFSDGVNLIILEGREKPSAISDSYIQVVLANINRFARTRKVPLLLVVPTIEEQVARNWCEHGSRVGDLIPEQKLYDGSRWYNFPGVSKTHYVSIVEETVRTLNPPHSLYDFGVSPDEVNMWVDTAPTIGRFIEILANQISNRRSASTISITGKKDHVWVVYCAPDLRHYDHTYLVLDGLCQDEKLRVSPAKLIPPDLDTSLAKQWRAPAQWAKMVATINFLDVRLVNLPIISVVTAALAYCDEDLLKAFKTARVSDYRKQISEAAIPVPDSFDWNQHLVERRLQAQNARESLERSNLFRLLRGTPAEPQKGGNPESAIVYAQYLFLRDQTQESRLHFYLGQALKDLLEYYRFPELLGVETETPLVQGQTDPVPDITVHTKDDTYALELHFRRDQFASSVIQRYAIENVIRKYMRGLPYLRSVLEAMV